MNEYRENRAQRSWARRAMTVAAAGWLLATVPAGAQERTVSTDPAAAAGSGEVHIADGKIELSLDEAIELALQRNLGLQVQRYARAQARLGIQEAMGAYDLALRASAAKGHNESATASSLDGADVQKQDTESLSLGLSQLVPSGGTFDVSLSTSKLETNSLFFLLNPSYDAGFDVTFRQPLLRNLGRETTNFGIEVSRLSSDQSLKVFEEQVISTIQNAELYYWGVVEAQEQLKVAEESKRLAVQLHENNRVRVDVGTLAPLELVSSEAGIATREEELIRARADVANAEDLLKSLLRIEGDAAWGASIRPETSPEIEHPEVDLADALATALASRPELGGERIAQKSRELEAAYYAGQTKPRLDLSVTYGFNGVGGNLVVRDNEGNVISSMPGGVDDALQQVVDGDFPGWRVALDLGIPIQNRSAKARALRARLAAEQGTTGIDRLEQLITTEVRLAVRAIETARQELESAKVSVRLQNANLDAERKKFLNGLSTSFQILQVEEDLTSARSREVRAVTGYRRALVGYYQAIGKLLDQTGVTISE